MLGDHGQGFSAQNRYSILPSAPVIGEGISPLSCQPHCWHINALTSAIAACLSSSSRTTPPLPRAARPASNWGLIRVTNLPPLRTSSNAGASALVTEIKERSHTTKSICCGIRAVSRSLAWIFSRLVTRLSRASFSDNWPCPTSTA